MTLLRPTLSRRYRWICTSDPQHAAAIAALPVQAVRLIDAYQQHGHIVARLDPLGLSSPAVVPAALCIESYGLQQEHLALPLNIPPGASSSGFVGEMQSRTLGELLDGLKRVYADTVGVGANNLLACTLTGLWSAGRVQPCTMPSAARVAEGSARDVSPCRDAPRAA